MLFFGLQVIAVIFAAFLHHGNGRAITSTSNDTIERTFDLAEEEINTVLSGTNEKTTEEETPADVRRLSEQDQLSSVEAVQSQFSPSSRIQPKKARIVLRQKRSHEDPCYTGNYQTVKLASGKVKIYPICKQVSLKNCGSSIQKYNTRKCEGSNYETVSVASPANGTTSRKAFPKNCSCAV